MTTTAMVDVYELSHEEFTNWLDILTTPEDILHFTSGIYEYLSGLFHQNATDSVLREWAFQWASEQLGIDYNVIYKRWLA